MRQSNNAISNLAVEPTDWQLIQEYARSNSQNAFEQLAARHSGWVYSTALRHVRDPHVARDVSQAVFIVLARKGVSLGPRMPLNAWLFKVTRYAAAHALRSASRRRRHERSAAAMNPEIPVLSTDPVLERMHSHLDPMVSRLNASDRQAILLRFYEQKSMTDVGVALGVSEDAAKKRAARAIERLRGSFRDAGLTIPLAALVAGLATITANSALASAIPFCAAATKPIRSSEALSIADAVVAAMSTARLKVLAVLLLLALSLPIVGLIIYSFDQPSSVATVAPAQPLDPIPNLKAQTKLTAEALQGSWIGEVLKNPNPNTPDQRLHVRIRITGEQIKFTNITANEGETDTFRIDLSSRPSSMDIKSVNGTIYRGIFANKGSQLKICWGPPFGPRPSEFRAGDGDYPRLGTFTRVN
jgi:RNA polymerase sigma factor (sigma-70 family)